METVTNIASAVTSTATGVAQTATRAIWGDGTNPDEKNETAGKEPVSGEVGDVKSGEPYDKGNADESVHNKSSVTSNTKPDTTDSSASAAAVLLPEFETSKTDTTTSSDLSSTTPKQNTTSGGPINFTKAEVGDVTSKLGSTSLEEKASSVPGTTGFTSPEIVTGATRSEELKKEATAGGVQAESGLQEDKAVKTTPVGAETKLVGQTSTNTSSQSIDTSSKSTEEAKKSLDATGAHGEEKEKKSLKEKIKAKLHKHKYSKE